MVGFPDTGLVGAAVLNHLISELDTRLMVQIEPFGFYPMDGVQVEDDIVDFAQNEMYVWKGGVTELILFTGHEPVYKAREFLDLLLALAEKQHVKRLYTVGGIYSRVAHTANPKVVAVVNKPGLKEEVLGHGLALGPDYEGPPSLNSFLLWLAQKHNIEAVSLWGEVPFYFADMVNPKVSKAIIECLSKLLGVKVSTSELKKQAEEIDRKLDEVRRKSPDIETSLHKLENQIQITDEEMQSFMQRLNEFI